VVMYSSWMWGGEVMCVRVFIGVEVIWCGSDCLCFVVV